MNHDFRVAPPTLHSLGATLHQIESAQLVRKLPEDEPAYLFKHALVQDSAYSSLTRHERKRLHHRVAETLEHVNADALDENAALLAYHFERAEEWDKALVHLQRAADWARRGAAYREQAALLKRAIALAETTDQMQLLGALCAQRGQALLNVTEWHAAQTELRRALEHTAPVNEKARAQILLDLAAAAQWLWNIAASLEYAQEALTVAERMHDDTLAASAMAQIAVAQVSDGQARQGIETYQRAFLRAGEPGTLGLVRALEFYGLCLYWLGESENALARSAAAIQYARAISDHVTIVRALSTLATTQAARGDYGAAFASFAHARAHAEQYNIQPWLARALSMQSGVHLDLFDYAGAEELMEAARIVARRAQFGATVVGTGIDLIFSSIRRGEFVRADRFVREVEQGIHAIYGSHRWLWEIRFLQARAELALAREQFADALKGAEEALSRSRSTGRRKYELLAQLTRAQARRMHEPDAALQDARAACALAVELDDPALVLRAALTRLEFERAEETRTLARAACARILKSLPESALRERFLAVTSEWF